jgi:hypothetical protein
MFPFKYFGLNVSIINYIAKCIIFYIVCSILHYTASHMYTYLCVPVGFRGFLMSPFLTLTPHCQFLRWVIYNGGTCINTMWFLLGGWLLNIFQLSTQNVFGKFISDNNETKYNTRAQRCKKYN